MPFNNILIVDLHFVFFIGTAIASQLFNFPGSP